MNLLDFCVNGQVLMLKVRRISESGNAGEAGIHFQFSPEWDGMQKQIIFMHGDQVQCFTADEENKQMIFQPGIWQAAIEGTDGTGKKISTTKARFYVSPS